MSTRDALHSASEPNAALMEARAYLQICQKKCAYKGGASGLGRTESTMARALEALQWRRKFEPTDAPGVVRRGLWKFVLDLEEQRIELAEELIRRTAPGAFEDPGYLALLAYQAASIEMTLGSLAGSKAGPWSQVLLGTLHSSDVNALARASRQGGYTVVMVHSALIDLVYQAAKAVVAAGNPSRAHDGLSDIRVHLEPNELREHLQKSQEPVNRLYSALEAYLYKGYPRAFANEEVGEESAPPLAMLIGLAERFVVGHEYGHGMAKAYPAFARVAGGSKWDEEFLADRHGMFVTVMSGATLDAVTPEVGLSAGVFTLACADVLSRALSVVLEGKDLPDEGSESHPSPKERARQIVDGFHEMFEVKYASGFRGADLLIRSSPVNPQSVDKTVREHVNSGAIAYANALLAIWRDVRELLKRDFETGRKLHPMWLET